MEAVCSSFLAFPLLCTHLSTRLERMSQDFSPHLRESCLMKTSLNEPPVNYYIC